MLKKLKISNPKEPNRLWYSDEYFDLIIWREADEITAFQLCYDIKRFERVLSWSKRYGFSHSHIDSGERNPSKNQSPLFVADGLLDRSFIMEKFATHAQDIDPAIRSFVVTKIAEYTIA